MTYIIKPQGTRAGVFHRTDDLTVRLGQHTRSTGTLDMAGLGRVRMVESAGEDDSRLRIHSNGTRSTEGVRSSGFGLLEISRRQSSLDKVVRSVRDDDMAALAAVDAEIEAIREALKAKRRERAEVVRAAWVRANKVPLAEVAALIP